MHWIENMVEKLEINFSLAKKLYKASDCTDPYQVHVNTFVEVGGKKLWITSQPDSALHRVPVGGSWKLSGNSRIP